MSPVMIAVAQLAQVAQVDAGAFDPAAGARALLPFAIAALVATALVAGAVAYGKYRWRTRRNPERQAKRHNKRRERLQRIADKKSGEGRRK